MISIVIPTYNEEKRLGNSLEKLRAFLKTFSEKTQVIIADDGSTDKTREIVEDYKKSFENLHLLKLLHSGKGAAINAGFHQAAGEIVVFTDADFSTPIEEITKLLQEINNGYDVVIGSRALDRSLVKKHQNFFRESVGKFSNVLIRTVAVKGIYDTQCGFKAFKKDSCQEIFDKQTIQGFAFDVELLFLAQRERLKIKEVPVVWYNDNRSSVHPIKDVFYSFTDLLKIRLRHSRYYPGTINKLLRNLYKHRTLVRFFLVGVTGTSVDYLLFLLLTRIGGLDPLQANPISVEVAIIWSFVFNNLWTFSQRTHQKTIIKRFLAFQSVLFGGLMISQMQMLIFIHYFNIYDLLAKMLTIPLVGSFNYIVNNRWTFKELSQSVGWSKVYPLAIVCLFVVYLLLVRKLTGSYSIFLPR